jgi:hypothetical protein
LPLSVYHSHGPASSMCSPPYTSSLIAIGLVVSAAGTPRQARRDGSR